MKKNSGFTLVELLVVIAIIAILASILLPALSYMKRKALVAEVKTTIGQLEVALTGYKEQYGVFPPNDDVGLNENTNSLSGIDFKYYNNAFIAYLDGDKDTRTDSGGAGTGGHGTSKIRYFNFKEQFVEQASSRKYYYKDRFDGYYWYHNCSRDFIGSGSDDKNSTKQIDTGNPYHPWYNRINFDTFQIYSKVDYPGSLNAEDGPYAGGEHNDANFQWVTNYSGK